MKHVKTAVCASLTFVFSFLNFYGAYAQIPAFPGAEGFGFTGTTGGRGGQVLKVTNLNCSGPGSLNAALNTPGAKYIIFTVSGIIDCAAEIQWGDCYIAGQTSPGGITVRGILLDDYYDPTGKAQNVIIRHLNSRPSTEAVRPGTGWVMDDALRLDGAKNIVIDHCSFANATDECLQLSRSSNITIQHCSLAETLGGHYDLGGMLMNYSVNAHKKDSVSIHHNIWNRIGGRMPEISCEESAESPGDLDCLNHPFRFEFSNNLLWDIPIQIWYEPFDDFFIQPNFVNNRSVGRASYTGPMFHHPILEHEENEIYSSGNTFNLYPAYSDYQLFYCCNDFNLDHPNTDLGVAVRRASRFNYPSVTYTPTANLQAYIFDNVGAFNQHSPMNRDSMNRRLLKFLNINSIDANPVNGNDYYNDAFLLDFTTQPAAPADTDNDGMPDAWETANGLNPNVQDHNGTELSIAFTGVAGYTNLECYLNQLSDLLVNGMMTPLPAEVIQFSAIPIAAESKVVLRWTSVATAGVASFMVERSGDGFHFTETGRLPAKNSYSTVRYELTDENAPSGQLFYRLVMLGEDGSREVVKTITVVLKKSDEWLRIRRNVPAGKIEIEVMDEMRMPVEVALSEVSGKILRRSVIRHGYGEAEISGLPSGVYFLHLSNPYLRHTEKVLVGW